jgi:hypothetical protein
MTNAVAEKLASSLRAFVVHASPADDPAPFAAKGIPLSFEEVLQRAREALREYDAAKGREVGFIAHVGTDKSVLTAALTKVAMQPAQPVAQAVPSWQQIETAPKDGTLVLLLVKADDPEFNPIEDEVEARTIGSYGVHGGPEEDPEWTFAGWDWDFDSFEDGRGIPIAWAPLLPLPQPLQSAPDAGGAG